MASHLGDITIDATDAVPPLVLTVRVRGIWRVRLGARLVGLGARLMGTDIEIRAADDPDRPSTPPPHPA